MENIDVFAVPVSCPGCNGTQIVNAPLPAKCIGEEYLITQCPFCHLDYYVFVEANIIVRTRPIRKN
jgi:ribosomal protein S27E